INCGVVKSLTGSGLDSLLPSSIIEVVHASAPHISEPQRDARQPGVVRAFGSYPSRAQLRIYFNRLATDAVRFRAALLRRHAGSSHASQIDLSRRRVVPSKRGDESLNPRPRAVANALGVVIVSWPRSLLVEQKHLVRFRVDFHPQKVAPLRGVFQGLCKNSFCPPLDDVLGERGIGDRHEGDAYT